MKSKFAAVALLVGLLSVAAPAFAHHGSTSYDNEKVVTITGTVTGFEFINPHCIAYIDVKDSNGNIQHWTMEAPPPSMMKHSSGWYKDMMKPGDQITVGLHAARNGSYVGKIAGNGNLTLNGKPIKASSEEQ